MANVRRWIGANTSTGFSRWENLDPGFRDYVESYVASLDFESEVFDANKIQSALKAYYEGRYENFRLLSILVTLAAGLPMFLRKKTMSCPGSAVSQLAQG